MFCEMSDGGGVWGGCCSSRRLVLPSQDIDRQQPVMAMADFSAEMKGRQSKI